MNFPLNATKNRLFPENVNDFSPKSSAYSVSQFSACHSALDAESIKKHKKSVFFGVFFIFFNAFFQKISRKQSIFTP